MTQMTLELPASDALLIGLVPTAFERLRESVQYRDALRSVMGDLRQARYRAESQGTEVRFNVDLAKGLYGIEGTAPRALPAPREASSHFHSFSVPRNSERSSSNFLCAASAACCASSGRSRTSCTLIALATISTSVSACRLRASRIIRPTRGSRGSRANS